MPKHKPVNNTSEKLFQNCVDTNIGIYFSRLSPEQYTRLVKHYRIFAKASIDKIVENDEEDDPYVKKDDWVSIDESEIAQNIPERKTISSPHTHKPLPPPSS